jgi:hypothetical protein
MSPAHDLMERLAAADPVPGPATIDPAHQREADALLERLLATPVEEPRRRTGGRRLIQLAAATAVAAVAAFAALSLFDSDRGPTPHVVARAVAALTQDDVIYHFEAIARATSPDMPDTSQSFFFEAWHTTSGRKHRKDYAVKDGGRGRLYGDFAGRRRPGRLGGPALRWDAIANTISESGFGTAPGGGGAPGLDPFDPSRSLKELQGEGRLHFEGRVDVDGREAYRLVSGPVRGSNNSVERVEFWVDPDSYLPLAQRYSVRYEKGPTMTAYWRYLTYERLPLNDETRSLLYLSPHPGGEVLTGRRRDDRQARRRIPQPLPRALAAPHQAADR